MKLDKEGNGVAEVEVINVWSGPRSLSTSLMYSFAQVPVFSIALSLVILSKFQVMHICIKHQAGLLPIKFLQILLLTVM